MSNILSDIATGTVTVTALPAPATCNGDSRRTPCRQPATINWHFAHIGGSTSDTPLCPQHAGRWMRDHASALESHS